MTNQQSITETQHQNSIFKKKSTIVINDEQLLDNLINGPVNQAQRIVKKDEEEVEEEGEKLGKIDSYNLEYVKKGGTISKHSKSVSDFSSTMKLPKIGHTTRYELPKPR